MAKIAVLNTKGGSGKSTNSFQVACAYFLQKNEKVELIEIDDENADSANFTESIISSKRLILGDGSKIEGQLFDAFGDRSVNQVVDIGGNKTTTAVIAAMAETKIYLNFDLFVIPIAGGYQDLQNAIKTTELIKPFGKPIIYSLSRARCDVSDVDGIYFQYSDFFSAFPNAPYYVLRDSHVVDLSRKLKKSSWEISHEEKPLQALQDKLVEALENGDKASQKMFHSFIKVYKGSKEFVESSLKPAFQIIDQNIQPQKPKKEGAKNA